MAPHRLTPSASGSDVGSHASAEAAQQHVKSDSNVPEPIAIVGMGCRLPGDVSGPSQFWDLLVDGRTGQCAVPSSRFNIEGFYHPKGADRPGSMDTEGGYFIKDDIRNFDNDFFGINPMEATYMDPQQRKLLEVVYEALEAGGASLEHVSGSNTGCYVGNFTVDFQVMQTRDPEYLHRYSATGMGTTILGNRISHIFNLKGPSLVIDTACSSSLYCLHVACCALNTGECDAAIVAGANLIQSAEQHLGTMKAGVLSATSTCHTFSDDADGYGRADGIGCLYIKRLSDAIRNNDPIHSVVVGTAINSNGRTPGITLPSAEGQEAVILKAYEKAGLGLKDTQYVETHGTGTPVGDPIEVEALARAFNRPQENRLRIGSVKTNLGHSEAASGISSIIKATLALKHGTIPATVGVRNINPKIKTDEWNIDIVTTNQSWPSENPLRRAGVNSFGYGGANAHAILESAENFLPSPHPKDHESHPQAAYLLPISAASETSLEARVSDLREYLSKNKTDIRDLAYTLSVRRSNLSHRGYLICDAEELTKSMSMDHLQMLPGTVPASPVTSFGFVFTGQGAQWPQMGKELLKTKVFSNAISEMDEALCMVTHAPTWSIREAILDAPETSTIHEVTKSQTVCTAIQIGLVQLLRSQDITPSVVIGHSSGEMAAAFTAGILSAAETIVAAYYRGWIVKKITVDGAMMAAGMTRDDATAEIKDAGLEAMIRVACVNSPESVTITGDAPAIDEFLGRLQGKQLFARKLKTGGRAYHSHHMLAVGKEYEEIIEKEMRKLDPSLKLEAGAKWISSVHGQAVTAAPGSYWRANLESPVLFADALEAMIHGTDIHLIEIGPHSALEMPIKQTKEKLGISDTRVPYSTALSRGKDAARSVLALFGKLYLSGVDVAFAKVNDLSHDGKHGTTYTTCRVLTELPTYKWNYERILWNESRASEEFRKRSQKRHELLGSLIPGTNGQVYSWRNLIRVGDIPWIEDHKLQDTIVFPGTGYLAMIVEALTRIKHPHVLERVELQNVNILGALALSADPNASVELFTTIRPRPLTFTTLSSDWWDFSVVSVEDGTSTPHATGSIRALKFGGPEAAVDIPVHDSLEPTAPRVWYDKLLKSGLNFGPAFQSIQEFHVSRRRDDMICTATVPLLHNRSKDTQLSEYYPIHPITLDAMLQCAIIATTSGITSDLRAKVPVRFESVCLDLSTEGESGEMLIDARANVVGFGASSIDAHLRDSQCNIKARFSKVRLAPYDADHEEADERHPMLRTLWKPDAAGLGLLSTETFTSFLNGFADEAKSKISDEGILKLGAALDLLSHKNPNMTILELGNDAPELSNAAMGLLHSRDVFKFLQTYTTAEFQDGSFYGGLVDHKQKRAAGNEHYKDLAGTKFDLVLLPSILTSDSYLSNHLELIKGFLAPDGKLLALSSKATALDGSGLQTVQSSLRTSENHVLLAIPDDLEQASKKPWHEKPIVIVEQGLTTLGGVLQESLTKHNVSVIRLALDQVSDSTVPPGTIIFALLEVDSPLLVSTTAEQMAHIKILTNNASSIVWVTASNLLGSKIIPEFALVGGLSRALMLEQPTTSFFTFDIDDPETDPDRSARNLIAILNQSDPIDFEFVQKQGTVHVSRFVPDDKLNQPFRAKQGSEIKQLSFRASQPLQLAIEYPGQFDSIYFRQVTLPEQIEAGYVQTRVTSVGLNAKDFYALGGRVDTKDASCMLEFTGVIERCGPDVSLKVGDRVVVMAPTHFTSSEIVPEWACQRLDDAEDNDTMATLSVAYATAIYALHDRARIRSGDSVLIHSATGGVGIAAIQIAQLAGAEIFATVSTDSKEDYLVKEFGLKRENIFYSRDISFLGSVMKATGGRGVDIVLNSLVGDLLHAGWMCCAEFGRFIEIGKKDLTDHGKLEMSQFLKNVTFSAFDMSNLFNSSKSSHHEIWTGLMKQTLDLFRAGKIRKIEPLEVFDIADLTQALRLFSSGNRMGRIAINFEDSSSEVRVQPYKYASSFSATKYYVMVGCLGGLGRSISKWMISRGARKFVFLGRSGMDKAPARRLIEDLRGWGASCKVVRGDVAIAADVQALMDAANGPLGGVVQAAMGLDEALFSIMSNRSWHTSIDPKVIGTWHLHNAIANHPHGGDVDFFLMTSSISGSVGTATESNYCAANHFLDYFARYRRSLGLPATSVGLGMISEVGYLHENPEIEALLLRKGIQAINEDELIQIIDIALASNHILPHAYDNQAEAHILTGLEPLGLKQLRKKGFDGTNPTLNDPRAAVLARALDGEGDTSIKGQNGLPSEIIKNIEDGSTLADAILAFISKRFSNLVLLPLEKVDVNKPLAQYGMDSMIAAEFRTWFYQAFKVDIPFLELLSKSVTIGSLSETVYSEVEQRS